MFESRDLPCRHVRRSFCEDCLAVIQNMCSRVKSYVQWRLSRGVPEADLGGKGASTP